MKLDYKKFKKVAADKDTTTLEHEGGHQIRVAHNKLSKENQAELHAIPMFASGGEVADKQVGPLEDASSYTPGDAIRAPASEQIQTPYNPEDYTTTEPAPTQVVNPSELANTSTIGGFASRESMSEKAPSFDTSNPKIPTTPQAPFAPQQGGDPYAKGLGEMKGGLEAGAKAQQDLAVQEAALAKQAVSDQQTMQQNYQTSWNELDQSRKDLMADIKAGHIDPNHYMDSKSDLGKISTAIGLIMGGIGGGGTSNPAMDFINKQIDRDIESQKASINSKHTLLSATMQQFGNLNDATKMAKVYQADIYKSKMEEQLALAKSPMVKAELQKAIGQLDLTYAPLQHEVAVKKAALSAAQQGNVDPATLVPHLVPKEHQKEVFGEIKRAQDTASLAPKILKAFELGSSRNPVTAAQGRREFEGLINTTVQDLEGTVKQAAIDSIHDNMSPGGLTASPGENEAKRRTVNEYLQAKSAAPTAKGYNIDLSKFRSTGPVAPEYKAIPGAPKRGK